MKNPFLIGEKIYLAPVEVDDLNHYLKWMNDQEVTRFLNTRFPLNRDVEKELLESMVREEDTIVLGIHLKETDKLIGGIGLHKIQQVDRCATFGIVIGDKEEWSKGYGTEATELIVNYGFQTLNLNRIELEVFAYNERGINCYEKVGFMREGARRQARFCDGEYYDVILMGILRQEWEKRNTKHETIHVV